MMWNGALLILLMVLAIKPSDGFEDYGFECIGADKIIPSLMVCDGTPACPPGWDVHGGRKSESSDESSTICVSDIRIRTQPLGLSSGSLTSNSVTLAWTRPENGHLVAEKLAGYILTAESHVHSLKTTLEHDLTSFNATELKPWTQYDITLRPFYESDAPSGRDQLYGRAETLRIHTKAAPPSAPSHLEVTSVEEDSVTVMIMSPRAWNGRPLGYRYHTALDPEERHIDAGADGNDAVVTLQVEAGASFMFYTSARCVDELGNELRGPEASLFLSTRLPAPVGLTITVLSLNTALFTWQQHQVLKEFLISLNATGAYSVSGHLRSAATRTFTVAVLHRPAKTYSFLLKDLSPLQNYDVSVQACSRAGCSSAEKMSFSTAAFSPPIPDILSAVPSGSDSFEIHVNVPHSGALPSFDGFQVRYCDKDLVCRQLFSKNQNVTVKKLKEDTSYFFEVRTVFKVGNTIVFGPPANTTVRTRSEVPKRPQLNEAYSAKGPHIIYLEWDFNNSHVQDLQVNLDDNKTWATCAKGRLPCDVTFHSASPHESRVFLRLYDLEPFTEYHVGVRGCSQRRCGPKASAFVRTEVAEPSEPVELSAERVDEGKIFLEWNKPQVPAGPITGYMVTWECLGQDRTAAAVPNTTITITDLPGSTSSCSFSVAAYNDLENGNSVLGKAAQTFLK